MFKKIVLVSALAMSAYSESCWTELEKSKLVTYDMDSVIFSIKDAVSCETVKNATVTIANQKYTTDKNGIVKVTLPDSFNESKYNIDIDKKGYISLNNSVDEYDYINSLVLLSKELPLEKARFVLSWAKKPADLDLHLKTKSYHISYANTRSIVNKVKLDRDATQGYGPETITVDKLKNDEVYKILVHKYSSDTQNINNKVQVSVYLNNKLDRLVKLKPTTSRCVEIATITDNKIKYLTRDVNDVECK